MAETLRNSTALLWNRSSNSISCYWDLPSYNGDKPSTADELDRLTYGQFVEIVGVLVNELRGQVVKRLSRDDALSRTKTGKLISVSVAIAIPEGPYLPLAVTAIHALNEPFAVSPTKLASTVLFPLDPSDEATRMTHMLEQVRPLIVLTASDVDTNRIQEIAHRLSPVQDSTTCEVLYRTCNVGVMDVRKLLPRTSQACEQRSLSDDALESLSSVLPSIGHPNGENRLSHVVYTSGSTGLPKACLSSIQSLHCYLAAKNCAHGISSDSTVLLASSLTFDPCFSDILATIVVRGTLALARRRTLTDDLDVTLRTLSVSHVLCTPTVWNTLPRLPLRNGSCRYPHLRVVALGGEPIGTSIVTAWARSTESSCSTVRLCATYGVTEACVYQTFGEVLESSTPRHEVGRPFTGMGIRICRESQHSLCDVDTNGCDGVGEIVLFGNQLDSVSSYFLRPDLSALKFVMEHGVMHYRTGDRGFVHRTSGVLFVMGRIEGEEGMVKINGVRTELGGIEAALVDQTSDGTVVVDAIVVARRDPDDTRNEVHAYVVLSKECLAEMRIPLNIPASGVVCTESPLLVLLYARCKVTRAVPSTFVILPRVPFSPTGKRYRNGVPSIDEAVPLSTFASSSMDATIPLRDYGRTGHFVADEISSSLNLRPSQVELMTTTSTFAMLGGDSLVATRITRAIYARHHDVVNSRLIGGEFGVLEGPFAAVHLLKAETMGAYVDWLDNHGIFENQPERVNEPGTVGRVSLDLDDALATSVDTTANQLYNALVQATTTRCTNLAMALLDVGADPNLGESGGRIGKTSGRMERMQMFQSSPLHLACLHGNPVLVKKLLDKQARCNSPNASSLFPIHLAASGEFHEETNDSEDERRLLCIKYLLDTGSPITIRDGSKQTILHAAARAGHLQVLRFALERWIDHFKPSLSSNLDSRDNWSRTPVHWAVLNGKVDALEMLIEMGCSANPAKPKDSQRRTSAASESPMEICLRVYATENEVGQRMRSILQQKAT